MAFSAKNLLSKESAVGVLLIFATALALLLDNSPLSWLYDSLLSMRVTIQVGALELSKPLLLWINDGLMALFFLTIGLEIKRELLQGELSSPSKAALPVLAALGGMVLPALVFWLFNMDSPDTLRGWGVPVATDIAFSLGILSLLGSRIPHGLKILLLSLAIIDDIGAIIVIALFYTTNLSVISLLLAFAGLAIAVILNLMGIGKKAPYILCGIFMWICVLKSGVHATLAGVLLAFTIPLKAGKTTPLKDMEHGLHPWVAYMIMPLFAFANAGVSLQGITIEHFVSPLSSGIMAGLFVGKQAGVFIAIFLAVVLGFCKLPSGVNWRHVYGMALLTGIGFTMSLFIGALAFEDPAYAPQLRLSVLAASALSAICGYAVLSQGKIPAIKRK